MYHSTLIEKAKKINVSLTTVSKELSNQPSVSTRKKIRDTAGEIRYNEREHVPGVIITRIENYFFSFGVKSIIDTAAKKNYNVFITWSEKKQSSGIGNIEALIKMKADRLIVWVTNDLKIFNQFSRQNIQIAFIDGKIDILNLPDDIGIAGYGFTGIAKKFYLALAVINQDRRNNGGTDASLLTNRDLEIKQNAIIKEESLWNNLIWN